MKKAMQKIANICSMYMDSEIQMAMALAKIDEIASVALGTRRKPRPEDRRKRK